MIEWVLILVLVGLLVWEKISHGIAERRWAGEREKLLDRIMARDFGEYKANLTPDSSPQAERGEEDQRTSEWLEDDEVLAVDQEEFRELAQASEAGFQAFMGPVKPE